MDALQLLREDHESVQDMLDELEDGAAGGQSAERRKELATTLVMAESRHEAAEEEVFWPTVRDALDGGDGLADEATGQESDGKRFLQLIEKNDPGTAVFEDAMARFITAARDHIDFEETQVWPALRAALDEDALAALGEKLASAKRSAPTRPHPHTPSGEGAQETLGTVAAAVDRARDKASGRDEADPSAGS